MSKQETVLRNEFVSDIRNIITTAIGILLCADKNNTPVKYSLPENNKTIMANKYQLYLPSEKQLPNELKRKSESLEINKL